MRRFIRSTHSSLGLSLCLAAAVAAQEAAIGFELSRIDTGTAWVSSYWGYNAPKLVYDGDHFYTVGLWGTEQATATGSVYRGGPGGWERFYDWGNLNYQPGMVLLDSQQRLVLVHANISAGPRILRQTRRGDADSFELVPLPQGLNKAGYVGAAMDGDRLILGYIGDPDTYAFLVAWVDLDSGEWSDPHLLAAAQRSQEPWTTWLYPLIVPDGDGFHLVVSNQGDFSSYYSRINYLYVPYEEPTSATPEIVAEVNPWTLNMAFAEALWQAADGAQYLTAQYKPEDGVHEQLVYRRDPLTGTWASAPIGNSQIAAVYEPPTRPGELWMPRTFGAQLQLFRSQPDGRSWQQVELADFSSYGLQSTFFLYGITPTSGSLLPDEPCAVFSSGAHPNLELWFVRFQTAAAPTAVTAVASAAVPQASRLDSARPNPFNASTVVPFEVHAHTQVDLAVYDVLGQRLFTLVHQPMAPGRYEARWDGDAAGRILSTGVYTLRLAVGDQVHSRKVTILR